MVVERDLPIGHPAAIDTVPGSPEHLRWIQDQAAKTNARDFPLGHPKAFDSKNSENTLVYEPGVDPHHPELEPFTGRTPEQAKAVKEWNAQQGQSVPPSPKVIPTDADKVNAALEKERRRQGVDSLTAAQTAEITAAVTLGRRSTDRNFSQ